MSASYIETFQVYLIVVEFAFYVMQAVPQRKIRSYEVRPAQSKRAFRIPFTRAQLADYLNCDRSALSRELSRMQREGLLDTYRSSFKLHDIDALRKLSQ